MANGRNSGKRGDPGRDSGGFVALPWSVMDCPSYATLSHPAKALLFEVARQFVRDNNGRMLLSIAHLKSRGWFSAGVIQKAKQELIQTGFIYETVKGQRPNKASWYAVTWRTLDKIPGYDAGTEQLFQRGAYRFTPAKEKRAPPKCKNPKKTTKPSPVHGTKSARIVPPRGIEVMPAVPAHGTNRPPFGHSPVPPDGHHLEMPSVPVTARLKTVPAERHPPKATRRPALTS